MTLAGKVAVVSGASRGIGLAIAEVLAGEGALVAGCARNVDAALAKAPFPAGVAGARGFIATCDVGRVLQVEHFAQQVIERLGTPDIVVNNAGVVTRGRLEATSEGDWDAVMDANVKGTFLLTRAFLPAMRQRGSGRIINLSSISGRLGTAELVAYCTAKHAVVGFTRALAEEVRSAGIAVNAICPGSVDTEMLRQGAGFAPQMGPGAIAQVALFLAAQAPLQLTGSCVDVFG